MAEEEVTTAEVPAEAPAPAEVPAEVTPAAAPAQTVPFERFRAVIGQRAEREAQLHGRKSQARGAVGDEASMASPSDTA